MCKQPQSSNVSIITNETMRLLHNNNNNNDDDNNKLEEHNKRNKMLLQSKRSSSLHNSFRSTALQASICQEQQEDERLVSVLQKNIRKNNGNLYDNDGRVMRIYS